MATTVRDADRFYGEPLNRFDLMSKSDSSEPIDAAHFKMWCRIAADEIRHARELQHKAETDCRHWREECGKLASKARVMAGSGSRVGEDNEAYRRDMKDAGRGHLLR